MTNNYVQLQFKNYQIDAVAMVSLLSIIVTDVFMGYFENTELKQTINETTVYFGYVDDTFIIYNSKYYGILLTELFRDAHPNIQFTMKHKKE